ncbi:MAG: hypothetical protein LBE13_21060 [Bacteroidales bacterium]|jgi:hypothetical protein|nr:hypothetical protein [Bacteroidales bacterium]
MITPEIKDRVLTHIVSRDVVLCYLKYNEVFPENELSYDEFILILEQFVRLGLLEIAREMTEEQCHIVIRADIYDFHRHGGFVAQEEILRANLEKLNYELLQLSEDINPSAVRRIEVITKIAASVTTALRLFAE